MGNLTKRTILQYYVPANNIKNIHTWYCYSIMIDIIEQDQDKNRIICLEKYVKEKGELCPLPQGGIGVGIYSKMGPVLLRPSLHSNENPNIN